MKKIGFLLGILSLDLFAMVAEPTRVVLWRRGETIGGEEFIVIHEATVDYLATLRRPTEPLKGIRYNCQVKSRLIQPRVQAFGANPPQNASVEVRTVYELKDCVETP